MQARSIYISYASFFFMLRKENKKKMSEATLAKRYIFLIFILKTLNKPNNIIINRLLSIVYK